MEHLKVVIVTCPSNIKRNLYSVSRQLDAFPPLPEHVEEVQLVVTKQIEVNSF